MRYLGRWSSPQINAKLIKTMHHQLAYLYNTGIKVQGLFSFPLIFAIPDESFSNYFLGEQE